MIDDDDGEEEEEEEEEEKQEEEEEEEVEIKSHLVILFVGLHRQVEVSSRTSSSQQQW